MFDKSIAEAVAELRKKSLHQIQVETAVKWAGRACAAARLGLHDDAEEYAHEAIEHAALSGDDGLLSDVRTVMRESGVDIQETISKEPKRWLITLFDEAGNESDRDPDENENWIFWAHSPSEAIEVMAKKLGYKSYDQFKEYGWRAMATPYDSEDEF